MRHVSNLHPLLWPLLLEVIELAHRWEPPARDVDSVELFSGAAAITKGCRQLKLRAIAYDKSYYVDNHNDLTTPEGWSTAFHHVMNLSILYT